jgi:hypothetical protein
VARNCLDYKDFSHRFTKNADDPRISENIRALKPTLSISITFGECQVVALPVAKRLLGSPLINKDFRGCYLRLVSGNVGFSYPELPKLDKSLKPSTSVDTVGGYSPC